MGAFHFSAGAAFAEWIAALSLPLRAEPSRLEISWQGHAKVMTTLSIYTHLFDDDHAETMAALEAMSRPVDAPNVIPIRRRENLRV
jgi:hypothetical protein